MDLKSYLRGLGLGMVVCACIIGLSNSRNKISDAEIKARAAKLGMVEQDKGVLTQLMTEGNEVSSDTEGISEADLDIPEITIVPAGGENSGKQEVNEADKKETKDNDGKPENNEREEALTPEDTKQLDTANTVTNDNPQVANENVKNEQDKIKQEEEKNKSNTTENKSIVVTVYPGEGSYTVSKKLANLGLVESADVFDRFLCQNGYDKRLSTGNYTIMVGSSAEKIAKQLTGG